MYNLLHKELHVSALFIGHLQVDKCETLVVVLDKYTNSNLVDYKHNGGDEPYDRDNFTYKVWSIGV